MSSSTLFRDKGKVRALPNMRLKLAGLSFLEESERLCPNAHELSFKYTAPCGHDARSLSAIR